jgi:hypothetical protein
VTNFSPLKILYDILNKKLLLFLKEHKNMIALKNKRFHMNNLIRILFVWSGYESSDLGQVRHDDRNVIAGSKLAVLLLPIQIRNFIAPGKPEQKKY